MKPENIEEPTNNFPEEQNNNEKEIGSKNYASIASSNIGNDDVVHLSGMFRNWFLDYASYVILERAVPHMLDGLKPVQRRILHSMRRMEDGRFNKVANIIGHTMQFHPHGDASIGDALVQLGQKDLLIDCQGNWGNLLTGDSAAAPRYIEARLTDFALEVVFNPKTTNWKPSYDGRNKEPEALPVKFPLLLAQGGEGIAVGLSSKILPHNFNELCDAAISFLQNKPYKLYPDFITGGYIDVEKYNAGARGGTVKLRAKISKLDNRTLVITEIPFGKTSSSIVDSILKANEKGKIKIKRVDDITAKDIEIQIHLPAGVSSDITIDALYAFTDCEVGISPNCCIISEDKPHFLSVNDVLEQTTINTKNLLKLELDIELNELNESLHFASLEKIFIENRIYKDKEFENANSVDEAIEHIYAKILNLNIEFTRDVTRDDILKLFEIKMGRILKFNVNKAEEQITKFKDRVLEINHHLNNLIDFTISWYLMLKEKYGKNYPRKTELRNFENIDATKVIEANEKLYINREQGFIGTSLKKDEFLCNCSNIDDIIIFYNDGKYKVTKVSEKMFVGQNVLYVNIFQKNDLRTIYNLVYRDGLKSPYYIKRCSIAGITRDKEYDLTKGTKGTKVVYFSANPNGEAEIIQVVLKPKSKQKILAFEKDFSDILIKGKSAMGNLLTKSEIHKILLKQKGGSTLGGRKVWFDEDILRLNYDGHGKYLGEFKSGEEIVVVMENGDFYTTNYDLSNHFDKGILRIEKYNPHKVWTAILYDADKKDDYVKRFTLESSTKKLNFLSENPKTYLHLFISATKPKVIYKFKEKFRPDIEIDLEEFIGVKSYKAKGKKTSNYKISKYKDISIEEYIDESEKITPTFLDNNNAEQSDVENIEIVNLGKQQSLFEDENKD